MGNTPETTIVAFACFTPQLPRKIW